MIQTQTAPKHELKILANGRHKWKYNWGCCYSPQGDGVDRPSEHRGKVDWHHPISTHPDIGLDLCEAHHSLLKGRRKTYQWEWWIDRFISMMRYEVDLLVVDCVKAAGFTAADIDKY